MTSSHAKSAVRHRYLPWLILAVILVVAIFFRFWRLNGLPPGLHPDEAANGLDIVQRIFHGDIRVIYATNGPRESLFFFLQAIFVATLGNTILALRLAPALIGVLAVVVTYLWASDWFGRRVGLLAAACYSINVWAITVTRDGFRASLTPLMVALVMWLLSRAIKTGRWFYYVLLGAAFGIGFYTYTAFGALTAVLVVGVIVAIIERRQWLRQHTHQLIVAIVCALAVMSPLIVFTLRHPGESTARASGTSFLNKDLNGGRPLQTLLNDSAKTLLQFNWHGDENSRHNTPGEPMLDMFVGVMFIIGLIYSIVHLHRPKYLLLLAVFGAMLLPAMVSAESIPHGLRTMGAAPAVFILAAVGINYILASWYKTFPLNSPARLVGLYLIIVLFALSTVKSYKQYFVAWAQDPRTYAAYAEDAVAMARYVNTHHQAGRADYIFVGQYTDKTIQYLTYHKTNYRQEDIDGLASIPLGGSKLFLISNDGDTGKALTIIRAKFPNGSLSEIDSKLNGARLFYVYETWS